jgi:GT2 family glycosyltransferase
MELSVIIINYNTFRLTSNCIRSLREKLTGVEYEIILIDNASTECDPELFSEKFPFIRLIKSKENTGFTGGNNLGVAAAQGKYLLLLNSDTELINNAPNVPTAVGATGESVSARRPNYRDSTNGLQTI